MDCRTPRRREARMVDSVGKNPQLAVAISLIISRRAMNSDAMAVMTLMKTIAVPIAEALSERR